MKYVTVGAFLFFLSMFDSDKTGMVGYLVLDTAWLL